MLQLHCIRMLFVLHLVCVSKTILKKPIFFLLFLQLKHPVFHRVLPMSIPILEGEVLLIALQIVRQSPVVVVLKLFVLA